MKRISLFLTVFFLSLCILTGCQKTSGKENADSNSGMNTSETTTTEKNTEEPTAKDEEEASTDAEKDTSEEPKSYAELLPDRVITPEELKGKISVVNVSPYSGLFLEEEYWYRVEDVYAVSITNESKQTIFTGELFYRDGKQDLEFSFEIIPPGKTVIVAEKTAKVIKSDKTLTFEFVKGDVTYLKEGLEDMSCLDITPSDESTLFVKNITKENIPAAWIFYRYTDSQTGTLLGGPCFNVMTTDLEPDEEYELEAEDWMDNCVILDVVVMEELPENESDIIE